jgi:hypothetical protein
MSAREKRGRRRARRRGGSIFVRREACKGNENLCCRKGDGSVEETTL